MAFLAPIGYAVGVGSAATATAAATGTLAASLVGAAAVGAAGYGIAGAVRKNNVKSPDVLLSSMKSDDKSIKEAEEKKLRKGRTSRQTLLTGPQGLLEPATVSKKSLLGD